MGAVLIGLAGSPVYAQQITDPSPGVGAMDVEPGTPITATFREANGVSVRPETVKVFVDEQDVTSQAVITRDFFSYRPTQPLSAGEHDVLLEFTNTQGTTRRVTWSFNVGTPIRAAIESVSHNAGNRPLAANEILLITVNGTPASDVSVLLIQDSQRVSRLETREVSPGTYVANALVSNQDRTTEGILVARLENSDQVRFVTAEQPVQLIEGATTTTQTLSSQEVNATVQPQTQGQIPLQPTLTNFNDGDPVTSNSFTLQGRTQPNASVQIEVRAELSVGGFVTTTRTLLTRTVNANADGSFSLPVTDPLGAPGTIYRVRMTASSGGQSSVRDLQLVRR
ncbi:MAG: hypothetical protein HC924_08885 [Synechococcaceae cyanobacterium SM2_3_2]|nr:hypothetical protein [Synechococcaceae cyanobacterium SM2_3_2]